jgi:retron-type reverse transcriptase
VQAKSGVHALQMDLACISVHTGVSLIELYQFVRQGDRHYRTFRIPKKSGGFRKIQAPSVSLKIVQRWIGATLLGSLPLADACTGYRKGQSIVSNAAPHAGSDFVFNVDIERFFPSITAPRVKELFESLGYNSKTAGQLTALTTVNGVLPQGAPSSPQIANLICARLDERLEEFAARHGFAFTRYCDDITISGKGSFRRRQRTVFDIIESEGFAVNHSKVRLAYRGQRQEVTGLVVNSFVNLPRERRRLIRAMVHRFGAGECERWDDMMLSTQMHGQLSYLKMVRPADRLLNTANGQ